MSMKIHHGPGGSYKSSGAIVDDLIPAFVAGRTIITNVRGMTGDRLVQALKLDPATVGEVINVPMDGKDGMENRMRLARVFHWAPRGAFIFIDEVQEIWKPTWREKDIRCLDWPDGPEAADEADRPRDFQHACSMHRHWNWDIVLTTQDIDWVRDEFRGVADGAYRHFNAALIGLRGRYTEVQHHPKNNGMALSHVINKQMRKIPKYVFDCYDSTATGIATDSISGKSLFTNPRLLVPLVVLVGIGAWVASQPVPKVITGGSSPSVENDSKPTGSASQVVRQGADTSADSVRGSSIDPQGLGLAPVEGQGPFPGSSVAYGGTVKFGPREMHFITVDRGAGSVTLSSEELLRMGWVVVPLGDCVARLVRGSEQQLITCTAPVASAVPDEVRRPQDSGVPIDYNLAQSGTWGGVPAARTWGGVSANH